jgi:choline dehydrogenase-like flavoprotein
MRSAIIIGAGPAGLTAARTLRDSGVRDVLVLERGLLAGGLPRHCGHLGWGLFDFKRILTGPAYAERLIEARTWSGFAAPGSRLSRLNAPGHLSIPISPRASCAGYSITRKGAEPRQNGTLAARHERRFPARSVLRRVLRGRLDGLADEPCQCLDAAMG